jgi:hypothetical protein
MFCKYCGKHNPDDAVFCESCGQNIRQGASIPPGQPAPQQPATQAPAQYQVQQPQYLQPYSPPYVPQNLPGYYQQTEVSGGGAVASLILGIIGIFAWILPPAGYAVTIVGLILGARNRRGPKRGLATAGMVLSLVFLIATVINSLIGAFMAIQ